MKRCRMLVKSNNKNIDGNLVWFNSCGKDPVTGKAIKYSESGTSFAKEEEAVATSLNQRLSVIRGELWYNINYGLPLFDKVNSKLEMDFRIIEIIELHEDVIDIESYESEVDFATHTYKAKAIINTKLGQIRLQI